MKAKYSHSNSHVTIFKFKFILKTFNKEELFALRVDFIIINYRLFIFSCVELIFKLILHIISR